MQIQLYISIVLILVTEFLGNLLFVVVANGDALFDTTQQSDEITENYVNISQISHVENRKNYRNWIPQVLPMSRLRAWLKATPFIS